MHTTSQQRNLRAKMKHTMEWKDTTTGQGDDMLE